MNNVEKRAALRQMVRAFKGRNGALKNTNFKTFRELYLLMLQSVLPEKEIRVLQAIRRKEVSKVEIKILNGEPVSSFETIHFDTENDKVPYLLKRFSSVGKVTLEKRNKKTSHLMVVVKKKL